MKKIKFPSHRLYLHTEIKKQINDNNGLESLYRLGKIMESLDGNVSDEVFLELDDINCDFEKNEYHLALSAYEKEIDCHDYKKRNLSREYLREYIH